MPFPRQRSRSTKKHLSRTPSGKLSMHYRRGKGSHHTCAICHALLQGTSRKSKKLARLTKTQRRPERKFGGVLCSNCVETLVKQKTRLETGIISRDDVPLNHLKYVDRMTSH